VASRLTLDGELMFPNDYLAAVEFKGRDVTLTIDTVSKSELRLRNGGSKVKPVLTFKETKKKFVCNVTNGESIAVMYGDKGELWVGKRITLFPTKVPCGRSMVDAIRIREKVPAARPNGQAQHQDEPPMDPDIPDNSPEYDPAEIEAQMGGNGQVAQLRDALRD
jgi:hypothetical protein